MAKEIKTVIKLQIEAGKASPAPPVGTALGPAGVNIAEFCKDFNDRTKDRPGDILPVVLTVYTDRSYSFVTKTPPASVLIRKAIKLEKGSPVPNRDKVGMLTQAQLEEIAKTKLEDLSAYDVEQAKRIIAGTARSMGVTIEK